MKKILLSSVALLSLTAGAMAADLPSRRAPAPIIAAVPVFTWTGFYVGVNAGYGWSTGENRYLDPAFGYTGGGSDGGFIGGGQIGYNYQIGSFVIGVETDLQYAAVGNKGNYYGAYYYGGGSNDGYFGTVRARAGVAFDRALIYVTGGFAYGDLGNNNYYGLATTPYYYDRGSDANGGWTIGGGVEYAFTNNLTAKVEGLYVNLDTKNTGGLYYTGNGNTEFGVVRAGLNFKFGTY
ncbi:outer membrane protein [Microvirga pudoricolor]|uniref:outer membrane protein n=1 Tax=Microvirga pudoricolor TaxID=2778729 RepID=UPI00194F1642|nr:outer membrane beta-barrel protein [Microvirga pudoricolor]MBM6595809.1 porin family protein [Microvirga pudoricolor]